MATIIRDSFHAALTAALPFISQDETRLGHLLIETEPKLVRFVATDGVSMAIVEVPHLGDDEDTLVASRLIPRAVVVELARMAKPRRVAKNFKAEAGDAITYDGSSVCWAGTSYALSQALDPKQFPLWRSVLPVAAKPHAKRTPIADFNPALLERAGSTIRKWFPRRSVGSVAIHFPVDALDPMRIDAEHPDRGTISVVLMPRRL